MDQDSKVLKRNTVAPKFRGFTKLEMEATADLPQADTPINNSHLDG